MEDTTTETTEKATTKKAKKGAATKAPAAAKKLSGRAAKAIEKMNTRLHRMIEWLDKVRPSVHAASMTPKESPLHGPGVKALLAAASMQQHARTMSAELFNLAEAGWSPVGAAQLAVGDLVRFRNGRADRLCQDGAYTAADLKELAVVSVHGKRVKLKTGANEHLGLFPASHLARVEQR